MLSLRTLAAICLLFVTAGGQSYALVADIAQIGTVAGRVTFRGEVPASKLVDGQGNIEPLLEVDNVSGGLRWAIVHLVPVEEQSQAPTPHDDDRAPADCELPTAEMDQHRHRFIPRVLAIRANTRVRFTNSDVANHNVRAAALRLTNQFNVYTGAGADYVHQFDFDPRLRPVQISCDIHPWMRAWIYVFDDDHFAVTDRTGRFRIDGVPQGEYRLVVRQPDGGLTHEEQVRVAPGKAAQADVEFTAAQVRQ